MKNKKEEINSLLDQLDEDSLDIILDLIKRRLKKDEKKNYLANPDAKKIWDKACELIRVELNEVSYNTWIKNIVPVEIKGNKIKLGVESEFHKVILEGRYMKLFKSALFYVTDIDFEIEFVV